MVAVLQADTYLYDTYTARRRMFIPLIWCLLLGSNNSTVQHRSMPGAEDAKEVVLLLHWLVTLSMELSRGLLAAPAVPKWDPEHARVFASRSRSVTDSCWCSCKMCTLATRMPRMTT